MIDPDLNLASQDEDITDTMPGSCSLQLMVRGYDEETVDLQFAVVFNEAKIHMLIHEAT